MNNMKMNGKTDDMMNKKQRAGGEWGCRMYYIDNWIMGEANK